MNVYCIEICSFTAHRYIDSEPTFHCGPDAKKSYLNLEETRQGPNWSHKHSDNVSYLYMYPIFARQPDVHMLYIYML